MALVPEKPCTTSEKETEPLGSMFSIFSYQSHLLCQFHSHKTNYGFLVSYCALHHFTFSNFSLTVYVLCSMKILQYGVCSMVVYWGFTVYLTHSHSCDTWKCLYTYGENCTLETECENETWNRDLARDNSLHEWRKITSSMLWRALRIWCKAYILHAMELLCASPVFCS